MVARGFTLIELCVALLIIAIISSLAWGQYQGYVMRTRQADVRIQLLALLQQLERSDDLNIIAHFNSGYYRFSANRTVDRQTGLALWLVQAEPQGAMAGTGGLGLDSRGYSCFLASQDAPCVPQLRERW